MVFKIALLCFYIFHVGSGYAVPEAESGNDLAAPELPLYYFDSSAYYFQKFFRATQQQGELFCKNLNMELVDVQSKRENDYLFDTIASLVDYVNTDFWTSGVQSGDIWYWTSTGQPFSYTNWGSSKGSGNCLNISYDSSVNSMSWDKSDCTETKYVICEGEGHPVTTTTTTTTTTTLEPPTSPDAF
ncbi:unnamed protein product [Phaedon cochleariae]|uniref:C-type lectin domain-containing protein n=1 Tax=Phaedon cochleariae TaxID=80249 RepID=A0A9N9X3E1_PHACE|nr:unnamed protein product [Phaedon cochleariae]